ncbi:MAG: hypothetical protein ACK4RK_22080 [Gemmataceae bacterium]
MERLLSFQLVQFIVESCLDVTELVGDIADFMLSILVLDVERENVCHSTANAVGHLGVQAVEIIRIIHFVLIWKKAAV